jgi:hypothetical protein
VPRLSSFTPTAARAVSAPARRARAWHGLAAFALAALAPLPARADALDDEPALFDTAGPEPVRIAPIHEGGLRKNRGINIPANLEVAPVGRLTFGYTASNSYANPGLLSCKDLSCRLEYESDHVGNLYFVSFAQPFLGKHEIALTVGSYRMDDAAALSPLHRLVDDRPLRNFHEHFLDEDGLPELSGAPDGRQVFAMTDMDGRSLVLRPKHDYALPLRLDLTRYLSLKRGATARLDLNLGLHLAYPLEGDPDPSRGEFAFARGLDLGLSVNLIRVKQLTANVAVTYHLQLARFRSDVRVVNASSPVHADDDLRSQYALTYGLRFAGTFGGSAPCSFGLGQVSNSAHYDKNRHFAYDPVAFEGGNNLRGALAGANDYGVISFGCEYQDRHYQVALVEDIPGFSQLVGDDGSGTSYDPDFAIGFSATWRLGRARESR